MSRSLTYTLVALMTGMSLTSCAPPGPPPPTATVIGSLSGGPIDPGGNIQITYTVTYNGAWGNIQSIQLLGLPSNSPASPTNLPVPNGSGIQQVTNVKVSAPARDGDWPLEISVSYGAFLTASAGIGTLRINNTPPTLSNISLAPNSHQTGQCGITLPVTFPVNVMYTVTDNNGANDLYDTKITQISPTTEVLTTSTPPLPLRLPTRDNVIKETVTTPIDVHCDVRAPQTWTWTLKAKDDDTPKGTTLTVTGTTTYSTMP